MSPEPLILISGFAFIFVILPLSIWVVVKAPPKVRASVAGTGLVLLVTMSFNLGRVTGLGMAWYHWRREYQEPMWQLQLSLDDDLKGQNTNRVMEFARAFAKEKPMSYGGEKLFEKGEFRTFVEKLSSDTAPR